MSVAGTTRKSRHVRVVLAILLSVLMASAVMAESKNASQQPAKKQCVGKGQMYCPTSALSPSCAAQRTLAGGRAMPPRLLCQPDAARSLPHSAWIRLLRQYSASSMPAANQRLPAALARADQMIERRVSAAAIG